MLRLLLTNDDGIRAEGIRALARRFAPRAAVAVVAPTEPNSATSHSITLHKPLRLNPETDCGEEMGGKAVEAFSCSGTPSDCVMLGLLHLFTAAPPHLVISGVNDGCNVAQDLIYSGTVGSALEGAVIGVPSLAVSLDGHARMSFEDAALVTELIISVLLYGKLQPWHEKLAGQLGVREGGADTWRLPRSASEAQTGSAYPAPGRWAPSGLATAPCLNVNIPDLALGELKGIRWTRAGYREYREVVKEALDPRGQPYYWIAGDRAHQADQPGTDISAVDAGYVSVTPISYDMTSRASLERLAAWLKERSGDGGSQRGRDD